MAKKDFITIQGSADSDIKSAFQGYSLVPTSKGTYLIDSYDLERVKHNQSPKEEILEVVHQGDGYVDDSTTLRRITNPEEGMRITRLVLEELAEE